MPHFPEFSRSAQQDLARTPDEQPAHRSLRSRHTSIIVEDGCEV
jgi:hypothetical protein